MNPVRRNRNHSKRDSRPRHFGQKRGFSPHRTGGGSRGGKQARLDENRFIQKAKTPVAREEFVPKNAFADFAFHPAVHSNVAKKGYRAPTPIQDEAIPHLLAFRDIIGIANTGTGKTAAFLLPIITKIALDRSEKALIITPTRELAMQINDEFRAFSSGMGIFDAVLIGGANMGAQIASLRRKPSVIIGTPGRIKDLIEQKELLLGDVKTLVLDEADRMLDMGFLPDTKQIVSRMPDTRQTLLFSATFSPEIEKISSQFLKNPVKISVRVGDTADSVEQTIIRVSDSKKKIEQLCDVLLTEAVGKTLIFGRTKWGVEKLSKELVRRGFKSVSIHGNKTQNQRKRALDLFKSSGANILVATDVASRGLDIENVNHVINYDAPATYEDYTHRVGRTGRAGKTGKAITFVE